MDGIEFGAGVILDDMLEDDDENAGGGTEHDGAVNGIPEEELLASFREFGQARNPSATNERVLKRTTTRRVSDLPGTTYTSRPHTMWACQ